jgi:hypothetical protein
VISYRPGTWFGIVGEHATVLLPPSEKARAGTLWALVDEGAGFDEVLDALVSDGLRALPGFVLLAATDDTTRIVVRGPSKATFTTDSGAVVVEGSASATWVERSLAGVTGTSVVLEDVDAPLLQLHAGLTRLAALVSPAELAQSAPAEAAPAEVEPAPTPAEPIAAVLPFPEPVVATEPEPAAEPEPSEELDVPAWASASHDPLTDPIAAEESAAESWADEPTGIFPLVPDEPEEQVEPSSEPPSWTPEPPAPAFPPPPPLPAVGLPPIPPAPPVPPIPPAPPVPPSTPSWEGAEDDHDGLTRAGAPDPDLLTPPPGIPGQPAAPAVTAYPVAKLEFSHGERVDVDRVVIIGRAPEAGRFSLAEQPLLVTVPSPHQEISSTHVEVRPGTGVDHGAAVVTDLGSTNGTVVVQPGLGPEELRPGVPVQLMPGALIDLGDGLTIRVSQP